MEDLLAAQIVDNALVFIKDILCLKLLCRTNVFKPSYVDTCGLYENYICGKKEIKKWS